MAHSTYEGVVRGGVIQLSPDVMLPENATVYVTVPAFSLAREAANIALPRERYKIISPRLADPGQASRFVMEVSETDGGDV